ncbi:hypothetical protein EON65_54720, partial [archaeon]
MLQLEVANRYWRNKALVQYRTYLTSTNIHYLAYKDNTHFKSQKHRACYMQNRQIRKSDTFLLTGGSFGAPSYQGFVIHFSAQNNNSTVWNVTGKRTKAFQTDNGCHSIAIDNSNQLYVFGGYDSSNQAIHQEIWRLNTHGKVKRLTDVEERVFSFSQRNCFSAATSLIGGEIVVTGGCDNPFQGAGVFSQAYLLPPTHPPPRSMEQA